MDLDDLALDAPKWNSWTRVQPVQIEGEERAVPREVRLCCAAARVGDLVGVRDGAKVIEGRIVCVAHSILHVELVKW